jgi:hypothetical protein
MRIPEEPVEVESRQTNGPERNGLLTLLKKEGHCIMQLQMGNDPVGGIWTQSAGNELNDARAKARRIWKYSEAVVITRSPDKEVWKLKFNI